jgi:hypothetical protein
MRILLPTGAATESLVRRAAAGYDADVVVTGEIASFLTPHALRRLLKGKSYDCVIISGMCTASFEQVERETGVIIYRGPRHAADLALVLPLLGTETFSRTIPADDFLAARKAESALRRIEELEQAAKPEFLIRGVKIGGGSWMHTAAGISGALWRITLHPGQISWISVSGSMQHPRMWPGFFPDSSISMRRLPLIRRIHP